MLLLDLTHNGTHPRPQTESDSAVFLNSRAKLITTDDLLVTYILTKFGADWSIFVDDRV